jgi:DNA mismatch repair protein MutL
MPKIVRLPLHVISRIAAGEVIERPVYAIKELIENALDADAQSIVIQIESGGLKKITVTDDGHGMDKEDLILSFKPHTTSKFFDESLVGIPTLGFRGEALASIAAISTLTIKSRTQERAGGWSVTVKEGNVIEHGPAGMPIGTTVTIENLFANIPARKKFLKSEKSEYISILDYVTRYALSYPHIRFLLFHNGKISIDVPKNQSSDNRISALLKKSVFQNLMEFKNEDDYLDIRGYMAHPQLSTSSQSKQFVMINDRPIFDKILSSAVKQAYGGLLPKNRYPVFILSIRIPFEAVDVNVHPRKENVSVVGKDSLVSFIKESFKKTLENHNLRHVTPLSDTMAYRVGSTALASADLLRENTPLWNVKEEKELLNIQSIQQFNKTYLMCTTKNNVLIIDQHAAHERILYEQLMDTYTKKSQNEAVLKQPIIIDTSEHEKELIKIHTKDFKKSGICFIERNGDLYVSKIPDILKERDIALVVQELLDNLEDSNEISLDVMTHTMITYLACRNAVKAGDVLTEKEAKRLVEKLENTKNNTTCPHGRPTTITLLSRDLEKWFRRG